MIHAHPLTASAFAPFGDVIEISGNPSFMINNGTCARYHDLAKLEFINGAANISLALGQPYALPVRVSMLERHPLGSQAFIPLNNAPFLIVVAQDDHGIPVLPNAFITNGTQGINYHRNIWHGVLTPLEAAQSFVIFDRVGEGNNLEEHHLAHPFQVTL